MNWLNRFLLANWSWLMDGMLLLMALIIGIQIGESHVHKEWNAEKSRTEQLAAKRPFLHRRGVNIVHN